MKPRYKVIADYPCARLNFGQIFYDQPPFELCYGEEKQDHKDYPHLFKKLEWWEDRQPEEFPHYVKIGDKVFKVIEWRKSTEMECRIEGKRGGIPARNFLPATREEFEAQQNTPCKP